MHYLITPRHVDRFLRYVKKTDSCWLWTGAFGRKGYGKFGYGGSPQITVASYRYAYEAWVGPIPDGLQIDHLCRVHSCVNPEHLETVTCRENLLRGKTAAAVNVAKTHCAKGHPFDQTNTWIRKDGARQCRACHRLRQSTINERHKLLRHSLKQLSAA